MGLSRGCSVAIPDCPFEQGASSAGTSQRAGSGCSNWSCRHRCEPRLAGRMEREPAPGREQFGTHLGESQLEHSRTHLDWTRPEFRAGSREPTRSVHKLPARPFPTKKQALEPQRRYRTLLTTIVRLVVNVPSGWPADRCTLPFSVSTSAIHRRVRGTVAPLPTLIASPITPLSVPTLIMAVSPKTSSPPG